MRRHLLSIIAVLVLPACGLAQTGLPPFGSLDRMGLEVRNNQSLNVVLAIPILSSPGRGMNLDFSIVYNSLNWAPGGGVWNPAFNTNPNALWGWQLNFNPGQTTYVTTTTQGTCGHIQGETGNTITTKYNQFKYIDPYGTAHQFNVWWQDFWSDCTQTDTITGTFTGYANDGSGYHISLSSVDGSITSVLSVGGFNVTSPGTIIDPNGNYISSSTNQGETDWTDSAGRVTLKIITGTSSIQYKVLDPTGAYQTTTLNLQNLSVKTNFGCSGVVEYTGTASVPLSLVLPNNQTYQFAYEPTPQNSGFYTARLQRVTLPTGGYHEYDYTGSNDGISCADGTTLGMNLVVSDGTNTATWNYVRNTGNLTTTITTPQLADTPNANDTVVTFNSSGQEVSRQVYANSPHSGTALRTINTTWATNGTPATRKTILEDGSTQSEVDTTYDSNGLLDAVSEYDWGSGAHGSLLRTTTFTYQTSTNYTNLNILNLVTSKQIKDGTGTVQYRQDVTYDGVALLSANCETGAAQHSDSAYPCSFNYRGNPTQVTTYVTPATPANGISKNFTYDWFGNLITAQLNCCQNKTWAYSSTTQYSQPDSVTSGTSPTQLVTSATYNAYTGQIATFTDENNLVGHFSYDTLRRPTQAWQTYNSSNVGGTVSYSFDDTHFTGTTTATIDAAKSVQQIAALDTLGRPNLSTTEDINNNVISKVSAVYDLAGRAYKTSNPYQTGSPSYWTVTAFDVLGRPTSVTLPDNSATTYTYATNTVTATDPTGKQGKSQSDAAGRLSNIWEPDPTNNNTLILQTSDTYNVLDELTQVTQSSQTRTFVYDALGRILSATTPEAGRVCFGSVTGSTCNTDGYDSYNNLQKRTDARGVLTSYGYDTLNRLTSVSYNVGATGVPATASVSLTYGTNSSQFNNGRLITMIDGVGSENYSYNNLSQMTQLQKFIGTTTYTTSYGYNLANELTQITYPSLRVVQQSVDAIGRLCEIAPSTTGCGTAASPYATGYGYNAAGLPTGFKYGNGIYASFGFTSDRLQLSCLDYSTTNRNGNCAHDATTKFGLTYSYGSSGSNNGLISGIADSVDAGRNATYTYDSLFRLTQAVTAGSAGYPAWGLSETYDRYGNRSAQGIIQGQGCTGITCPTNSVTPDTATNRISGDCYDANGNLLAESAPPCPSPTYVYDAENHMVSYSSAAYTYDGNGLRVKKVLGSTTTVYVFSGSKVIAEYDNGAAVGSPSREYIYAGAALLAKIDSSGTKYYHQDHLSNRLITDSSGNTVAQQGHFPFGEQWYPAPPASPPTKWEFTTYERDSESGNDYAQARYNMSRLARFSSPDPIAGSTADPQSLNRYSYVRNMPVMLTDPSGLYPNGGCIPVARNSNQDSDTTEGSRGHGPSWNEGDPDASNPEPQGDCANSRGGGGSIFLDGVDITGMGFFLGSGGSYAVCPNGDCSIFNQAYTGQNGQQYWVVPSVDGLTWMDANGEELDPSTPSECLEPADPCLGSLDGLTSLGLFGLQGPGGPGAGGPGGRNPTDKIRQKIKDALKKEDCAKLLGGFGHANRLANKFSIFDVRTSAPPTYNQAEFAAWDFTSTNKAASTASFSRTGNIYVNIQFWDVNTLTQATITFHELRHQEYGTMGEPAWGTKAYSEFIKQEYATIQKDCFK